MHVFARPRLTPAVPLFTQLPAMAKPTFWRQLLDAAGTPGGETIRADVIGFMANLVDVLVRPLPCFVLF